MRITERSLQDLKKIILADYGYDLSHEELLEIASSLLLLTRVALANRVRSLKPARLSRRAIEIAIESRETYLP